MYSAGGADFFNNATTYAEGVWDTPEAKECFDYLLDSKEPYVVVLNEDGTIAGIVTKTSVARSVSANLWGDAR